jgi:hypothetical protein
MGDLKKAIHKPMKFYGCIASKLFLGHFLEMGEILELPSLQIFYWVIYTSLLASVHQTRLSHTTHANVLREAGLLVKIQLHLVLK